MKYTATIQLPYIGNTTDAILTFHINDKLTDVAPCNVNTLNVRDAVAFHSFTSDDGGLVPVSVFYGVIDWANIAVSETIQALSNFASTYPEEYINAVQNNDFSKLFEENLLTSHFESTYCGDDDYSITLVSIKRRMTAAELEAHVGTEVELLRKEIITRTEAGMKQLNERVDEIEKELRQLYSEVDNLD